MLSDLPYIFLMRQINLVACVVKLEVLYREIPICYCVLNSMLQLALKLITIKNDHFFDIIKISSFLVVLVQHGVLHNIAIQILHFIMLFWNLWIFLQNDEICERPGRWFAILFRHSLFFFSMLSSTSYVFYWKMNPPNSLENICGIMPYHIALTFE